MLNCSDGMSSDPIQNYLDGLLLGNTRSIARAVTLVENQAAGYEKLLTALPQRTVPIIGITGPPGAGKSTLTDALIGKLLSEGHKIAVLCVDPSSPFNRGALLGDRIRMSEWYTHPGVYIRSLASKGSLGGLPPRIIEISELMKAAGFDYIIIETVGVGQSEVEIAGLADCTVVVLVPEAGDEIQTMKAGLMEIADLFVVNKGDRPGADAFVHNLRAGLDSGKAGRDIPVLKTIANERAGIKELFRAIDKRLQEGFSSDKKFSLMARRVLGLIRELRMRDVSEESILAEVKEWYERGAFNLFRLAEKYGGSAR